LLRQLIWQNVCDGDLRQKKMSSFRTSLGERSPFSGKSFVFWG
jgi:hypothetical protein